MGVTFKKEKFLRLNFRWLHGAKKRFLIATTVFAGGLIKKLPKKKLKKVLFAMPDSK